MKRFLVTVGLLLFAISRTCVCADVWSDQLPKLPSAVAQAISDWMVREPALVKALIMQGDPHDYVRMHRANNDLLASHGIANLSRSNYVFVCPAASDYIIKISGPVNRLVNTIVENGFWPTTITDAELLGLRRTVTYQTTSSLPVYLSYRRLIEHVKLNYVCLPTTYLLHVPGADAVLADSNYVIVQEKVSLMDTATEQRALSEISDDQLREIMLVIATCGLWDISGKLKVAQDGRIAIVDLEQPNVTRFARRSLSDNRFLANARAGLQGLAETYGGDQQKIIAIHEFAKSIG